MMLELSKTEEQMAWECA